MSRISRSLYKVFAASAPDIGIFGSAQANAGPGTLITNPQDVQSLSAYTQGWLAATIGAEKFPCLEEIMGIEFWTSQNLAYVLQEGVPEYDANTTYYSFSYVKKPGTFQLYGSLVDANVGNALTDNTKWQLLFDPNNQGIATGTSIMFAGSSAPTGFLPENGAAVSRTTYANLYAALGGAASPYGQGDGFSTFNVPDSRGKFKRAVDDGAGVDPSRAMGSTQLHQFQGHGHLVPHSSGNVNNNGGNIAGINVGIDTNSTSTTPIDIGYGASYGSETRPTNIAFRSYIKY